MARKQEATDAAEALLAYLRPVPRARATGFVPSSPRNRTMATQNILKVHDHMSSELRMLGEQWYPSAHAASDRIAGGDVRRGAGVIAALSPQRGWEVNLRHATESLRTGRARGNTGPQNLKAQRIMDGEDPEHVLGPLKERSFYHSILNPQGDNPAIDRHAHDLAAGRLYGETERGLGTASRYHHFQEAYRSAANHLGVSPNELQAVTWTGWRGTAS